jgi:hypothetical protein
LALIHLPPFAVILVLLTALVAPALAQNPVQIAHGRVGNNTEGATLVTAGPFAEHVAVLDGYDVIAVPVEGRGRTNPQKMFDIKGLGIIGNASGIVYVPSERAFLFNDNGQPDTLLATDERGHPLPARPITYRPEVPFVFEAEGMTYLPPDSPFPDRIARVVFVPPFFALNIEILTRAGVVEKEIPLGSPFDTGELYPPGLAYDHFSQSFVLSGEPVLASSAGPGEFWRVGLDGSLRSGPILAAGGAALSLEALAELRDGRIVAADYAEGKLRAFNRDLTSDPSGERDFRIGVGVSRPGGGVYDPLTRRYALSQVVAAGIFLREGVAEITSSLDSASRLFGFDGTFEPRIGIAYIPEDDAFAMGHVFGGRGIDIFRRDGRVLDTIDFSTIPGIPRGSVSGLAYRPRTRQFAVTMFQFPNQVFLVSRARTLDGTLNIPVGTSIQYVSQAGQDRLLLWSAPTLSTYDWAGNLLAKKNLPVDGLVFPTVFIAGPGNGFAILDSVDSEVVVYAGNEREH